MSIAPINGKVQRGLRKRGFTRTHYFILAFLMFTIAALYLLRVQAIIDLSPYAYAIEEYNKEAQRLRIENDRVRTQVITAQSLTELRREAEEKGFVDCSDCVYIITAPAK